MPWLTDRVTTLAKEHGCYRFLFVVVHYAFFIWIHKNINLRVDHLIILNLVELFMDVVPLVLDVFQNLIINHSTSKI